MIDNNTLYGIVIGILITNFLVPFVKSLLAPTPRPVIDLATRVQLPTMNSRDVSYCLAAMAMDDVGGYVIKSVSPKDEQGISNIVFTEPGSFGEVVERSVRVKIDDTLPDRYPLGLRAKKK